MVAIQINTRSLDDYRRFLAVKRLPRYAFNGRQAIIPDEYAAQFVGGTAEQANGQYEPVTIAFDYQRDIASLAIRKRKFAVFADCGLGKTIIMLEFIRHAASQIGERKALIVSPLMVVSQTLAEAKRFYGDSLPIEQVAAKDLQSWLNGDGGKIGITNYDALADDMEAGQLGALACDESSMLKSMYGKWGQTIIRMGKGLDWKLCLTGTPAPNDRIEYGNHAVFLDQFPTLNAFLARYFVNRGQTCERWVLKPHALEPFYRSLSHWCIFLNNPGIYGWKDNAGELPPIHVHHHHVETTAAQDALTRQETGELFASSFGGITSRSTLARIAKGTYRGGEVETNKYDAIAALLAQWPDESTIIWCLYNDEQDRLAAMLPDAGNIDGSTPLNDRLRIIGEFKRGERKVLISKAKILGFGLNLQICTRMIFSSLQDSYESYYQAVKRANRFGSTKPLNVHIPVSDLELPMVETVLKKARMVQDDAAYQEQLFKRLYTNGDYTR